MSSADLQPSTGEDLHDSGSRESVDVRSCVGRAGLVVLVLASTFLTVGWFGQVALFDGAFGDADADAISWIAERRIPVLDKIATIGSTFADTWTVIGVTVGAVSMLLAAGRRRCATLIIVGISIELATFFIVGGVIDRPRPDVDVLHSVPSTSSFPSGHVAVAFVLYGSLTFVARTLNPRAPSTLWVAPVGMAVVVAASRMYEGVHHPTDVVAGLAVGAGALLGAAFTTGFVEMDGRRVGLPSRVDEETA